MPLVSGDTFAGFKVLRMLGAGAMGEVYLVQHPRLPRRDALKVLSEVLTADRAFRERFNREADTIAALWHPHIVGVHDRGEFDGHLWISMDFVDGSDAAQLLDRGYRNGMPVRRVLQIVSAVAGALDYAHQHRLLHRDVKPANILIGGPDSGERIVLADFGIAKQLGEVGGLTQTNMAIGTVAYAAPEQLSGALLDGRADQYALAATAFHLLVGSAPYQNSNPAVVVGQHLTAPPPIIGARRPDLAILQPAFSTAMAKDPRMRYTRCADFGRELERLINSNPIQSAVAPPPGVAGFAGPPQAPKQRNRLWLGVAAGAVFAAALVAVVTVVAVQMGSGDEGAASAADTSAPSASETTASETTTTSTSPTTSSIQPVRAACDALADTSVPAITAVNEYVDAYNINDQQARPKERPAIDALHASANRVGPTLGSLSSQQLRDGLQAWVDAARALAGVILSHGAADQFNAAIVRLNDSKTTALNLCDAAY
jgi:serine/threonine-protein kinase